MSEGTLKVILGVDAISQPLTGIGRYTFELAQGLLQAPDIEARFFTLGRWVKDPTELIRSDRPSNSLRARARQIPFRRVLRRLYHGFNRLRFNREVKHLEGFLYHSPNFSLIPFDGPSISTFHDLSVIHYPQFHPEERVAFMSRALPLALERADHLIAI
ncbi:MAG: hypothetical protein PHE55_15250, partial [Methylococcaceae bacterium]|nr:hypothetical protein [Methylococcaceae bacterium]